MGYLHTREDFANMMFALINPLEDYYSFGNARLKVGNTSAHYPDESAWMEGFSRPLWGLGAYWAGGGSCPDWEERYRLGIRNGVNPQGSEYWGTCGPYDQRFVEMAAIAVTLIQAPQVLLQGFTEQDKENLFAWLSQINQHPCCACNWRFFHIIVNVALKKHGRPFDEAGMEDSLQFIENCYVGDGWYLDGIDAQADYYVPFGMHFYGILYAMFMKEEDPERAQRFIDRAMEFGGQFAYWFDEEGQSVPYGRSLTYRFAQSSFYTACVIAGIEPLPLAVMKGILVRNLEYWWKQRIFDNAGVLTIGYHYPNLHMAETYNAPGSPYWCMKYFAVLALPEDAPFWQVEAEPLPKLSGCHRFSAAKMLLQRTEKGHAVMYPAGMQIGHVHAHMEEKYSKFTYSTKYGFSVMISQMTYYEAAPDCVLAFEIDGHIFPRRNIDSFRIVNVTELGPAKQYLEELLCKVNTELDGEDIMTSVWSPFQGIQVESQIIPTKRGHLRIHKINCDKECVAYDTGFAMTPDSEDCKVYCLQGEGVADTIVAAPNTNIYHSKTKLPHVKYKISCGESVIATEVIHG